jgi:hypothetical protein
MSVRLHDVQTGLRLVRGLPAYFRSGLSHEQALAIVRRRLSRRAEDFLALMRQAVYDRPASPFARLLGLAGCDYGDLQGLVQREGLEAALGILFRRGVYLNPDELSGRVPVRRGNTSFEVSLAALRNPHAGHQLPTTSSGATAKATGGELILDLKALEEQEIDRRLAFDAERTAGAVKASWSVPGSSSITFMLLCTAHFGEPPARWFTHVDPGAIDARYRHSANAIRWAARALGHRFPRPEWVRIEEPLPIARWLASVLASGRKPYLATSPSGAARLAQSALAAGIDIAGSHFSLRGEPVTGARAAEIERAGVTHTTLYGTTECGLVAQSCLARAHVDEVHLHSDLHALLQVPEGEGVAALPAGAILMTSIRPRARVVLINTSMGDSAICTRRACGCAMADYGWDTQLHTIRSFEKLTAMGMTFADAEVAPILELRLPARFGGTGLDYQLQEQEHDAGRARLALVIHPQVGPLDEAQVVTAFLDDLARLSDTRRLMSLAWRSAGVVHVERRAPAVTGIGKVLHFRAHRPS